MSPFGLFKMIWLKGEEEELEIEEEEEQKGPDLKLASRRDMYSICQSVGLGKPFFFLPLLVLWIEMTAIFILDFPSCRWLG